MRDAGENGGSARWAMRKILDVIMVTIVALGWIVAIGIAVIRLKNGWIDWVPW